MREKCEWLNQLSEEEKREEVLASLSDGARFLAEEIAILRRSYVLEYGTEEEFDRAFNRELNRANRRFGEMSKKDITLHMLLQMVGKGTLDIDIEGGSEDA